jgi:hypothetical protein
LDASAYGSHTLRWSKNLRAVQLLFGHSKLESTVRYLAPVSADGDRCCCCGQPTIGMRRRMAVIASRPLDLMPLVTNRCKLDDTDMES